MQGRKALEPDMQLMVVAYGRPAAIIHMIAAFFVHSVARISVSNYRGE